MLKRQVESADTNDLYQNIILLLEESKDKAAVTETLISILNNPDSCIALVISPHYNANQLYRILAQKTQTRSKELIKLIERLETLKEFYCTLDADYLSLQSVKSSINLLKKSLINFDDHTKMLYYLLIAHKLKDPQFTDKHIIHVLTKFSKKLSASITTNKEQQRRKHKVVAKRRNPVKKNPDWEVIQEGSLPNSDTPSCSVVRIRKALSQNTLELSSVSKPASSDKESEKPKLSLEERLARIAEKSDRKCPMDDRLLPFKAPENHERTEKESEIIAAYSPVQEEMLSSLLTSIPNDDHSSGEEEDDWEQLLQMQEGLHTNLKNLF